MTPDSTPEKPKQKQWRKVKGELEELRNFKSKIEKAEIEQRQEQKLADLEQRLTSRLQAEQAKASSSFSTSSEPHEAKGEDLGLNKVQQKLAARLLEVSAEESALQSWHQVEKTVENLDGKDLTDVLRREGLAVPKTKKDRQKVLHNHLRSELGLADLAD